MVTLTPTNSDHSIHPSTRWVHWPVNGKAVLFGALSTLALVIVFGLLGLALGAHLVGPSRLVLEWKTLAWLGLAFNVAGVFFAFVGGGWVAGKLAGIRYSEHAMINGALVWVIAVPLLLIVAGQGASTFMGSWLGGLSGNHPAWNSTQDTPMTIPTTSADKVNPSEKAKTTNPEETMAAKATRNAALGAVAALLLGLMGCTLGGWLASGEPMTLTHWKHRTPDLSAP